MIMDEFIWTHGSISGLVYVGDCTGLTMGFMAHVNPSALKKFIYYVQEALLVRLKAIHFINVSPVVQLILNIIKPLMKQELMNMVRSCKISLTEFSDTYNWNFLFSDKYLER